MKFSCTQENFHRGLDLVARASGRNAALPILSNILIRAESTGIRLSATNLEIGMSCLVRGKVDEPGAYTAQGKLLNDFVALLPGTRIDVWLEDGAISLCTDRTKTSIKGMSAEEFPLIPSVERSNPISVAAATLKQAISQTIFAAALDTARPEIGGVYVRAAEGELTLAATDSYRLAERRIEINNQDGERSAIVPTRALQELLRILDEGAETVTIFITDNQFLAQVGDVELISRLIEGKYPDYEQIIPKDSQTQATVGVAELVRVVKGASLFCKTGINDVTLTYSPKGSIRVSAANTQVGENETSIDAKVNGREVNTILNYRFLLDGLASIHTDQVKILLIDSENPGLLTPADNQPFRYLIMPIRQ